MLLGHFKELGQAHTEIRRRHQPKRPAAAVLSIPTNTIIPQYGILLQGKVMNTFPLDRVFPDNLATSVTLSIALCDFIETLDVIERSAGIISRHPDVEQELDDQKERVMSEIHIVLGSLPELPEA